MEAEIRRGSNFLLPRAVVHLLPALLWRLLSVVGLWEISSKSM